MKIKERENCVSLMENFVKKVSAHAHLILLLTIIIDRDQTFFHTQTKQSHFEVILKLAHNEFCNDNSIENIT